MDKVKIGNRYVGKGEPVFIVAEIGSNHDGKLKQAKHLIHLAQTAGADAVKFQSFSAKNLLNRSRLNDKGRWVRNPVYKRIERLELPGEWHKELSDYAKECGILFISTPFDEKKARLLNDIGVAAFKISSGDLNYLSLLKYAAGFKRPMIISTGMSTLKEIKEATDIIKKQGNKKIILLHCVSVYPPDYEDINLRAMLTISKAYNLPVGISDHTEGLTVPIAAVALGACLVEKHITIDKRLKGPDHYFALPIDEFAKMVKEIRNVEKALGSGVKKVVEKEQAVRIRARRSIYAKVVIPKGETISRDMVKVVRPAYNLAPKDLEKILGKTVKKSIPRDTLIKTEDLWL